MAPQPTDPLKRPKRFYKAATAAAGEGGFAVLLDGRVPKSPGGERLILPTLALAETLAAEWAAQGEYIVFPDMPATRLAHTALDHIPNARAEVADEVSRYAGHDVLIYRAQNPSGLVARQEAAWDPWLAWAANVLGVGLTPTQGVVHQDQPAQALERVRVWAADTDDFTLAGLAFATSLLGSAILALAVQRRALTAPEAYELSRLDEAFQEERWGIDDEAAQRTARLRADAVMLEAWFSGLAA